MQKRIPAATDRQTRSRSPESDCDMITETQETTGTEATQWAAMEATQEAIMEATPDSTILRAT